MKKLDKKNIEDILALTPVQEGMLYHYLKDPDSDDYFEQLSLSISGPIDIPVFEKTWNSVIEANEMLRVVFRWEKLRNFTQLVLKHHAPTLRYRDKKEEAPDTDDQQWLEGIRASDRLEKFDLTEVPFRVTLCTLDANRHEMIISSHHILYDGWSTGIILKEYMTAYRCFTENRVPPKPVKSRFKDFLSSTGNRDHEVEKHFWSNFLHTADTRANLSIRKKLVPEGSPQSHREVLCAADRERAEKILAQHHVTMAGLVYAAWGLLLGIYNHSEEALFGTTVSGRSAKIKDIENMVGLFINTLPLPVSITSSDTAAQFCSGVNRALRERAEFETTGLTDINGYCGIMGSEELFDTVLVIENYPIDRILKNDDTSHTPTILSYKMEEQTHYPLTVGITISEDIRIELHWKEDTFDRPALESMGRRYLAVLRGLINHPDREISQLELISGEEKRQLLAEFNDTRQEYPRGETLHGLFEKQAALTPEHTALCGPPAHGGEMVRVSYRQLKEITDALSAHLNRLGLLPGHIAVLETDRSLEMVIAILAVLKAGAAYLPTTTDTPRRRIDYIMADSHADLLITTRPAGETSTPPPDRKTLHLAWKNLPGLEEVPAGEFHPGPAGPNHPAYIIYTSGSTGRPKGVPVEHASAVNLLFALSARYPLEEGDTYLLKTPYVFDVSVSELFGWYHGAGRLVIAPEGHHKDPWQLTELIERFAVTHINFVPSMFQAFLDILNDENTGKLSSLKYIFLAGEALPSQQVESFRRLNTGIRLENLYGPTEATVYASWYNLEEWKSGTVPIGKPLPNLQLYILGRNLELMPPGVAGELCIGGSGVARGYLNRPELTEERFVSPETRWTWAEPGGDEHDRLEKLLPSTLYRTSDLARLLPDGNIQFLGRMDKQVKIRGFRIEMGEIEYQLSSHPDINEAVVKTWKDEGGNHYLAAYYTSATDTPAQPSLLKKYLEERLPHYMVPSFLTPLEQIPLNPNGKVDARQLPLPDLQGQQEYIAPNTPLEKQLVDVWAELLKLPAETIGIGDNFFERGGHSLKLTRLAAMIRKQHEVQVSIGQLFELPTIQKQAKFLRSLDKEAPPAIQAVPKREHYALSYAQRRLWIICQFEKDNIAYNEVGALGITGSFNPDAMQVAIDTMAERHETLRTVFITVDGEPRQKILPGLKLNMEYIDLRSLPKPEREQQRAKILRQTANKAFDLENGPLAVFKLLHLDDNYNFLVVNIHHIINDGWSVGILRQELFSLYNHYNRIGKDSPSPLQPLEFQYKDYSHWHNQLIEAGYFETYGNYWLEKFKDKPTGIELPLDYPRQPVQTFNGGRVYYSVSREQLGQLEGLFPEADATMFMKLLTLLQIFLYRISGQPDIITGSPIAGRNTEEVHQIIGFLVNTLVYRITIDPAETVDRLLKRIRKETLSCYENQDYPFDILVERLELTRDMSRSPLFNVLMAYNNMEIHHDNVGLDGVQVENHFQVEDFNPSVFDLVFFFDEKDGWLSCEIMYNSDLFRRDSAERMAANMSTLVRGLLEQPELPISRLDCVSEEEYRRLVYEFNSVEEAFEELTIQALVENRAAKIPNAVAVVTPGGSTLTYGQLNSRANRLARYLRNNFGIITGDIIGICVDRSLEMVISILGAIKSGAGYLSIDPNYPRDRVQHMLLDSRTRRVVVDDKTHRANLFDTKGENSQTLIDIFSDWPIIEDASDEPLEPVNSLSDIVYIIYTSGTTGTPNGAMLSHGILSNLIQWQDRKTTIDTSGRCLQFTSINFCVSFQEIFTTLNGGGEIHLIGDVERQDTAYLLEFLIRRRINNLYLPFSYLNFLFNMITESRQLETTGGTSLKHIITAGEQLKITSGLKTFLERNPHIHLHNHYGSSEMHVVTSYTLDAANASRMPVPPAGSPISNTRIYILDEDHNPVPTGVWGELFIDGCVEVSGYIHNPQLTDKKLVLHPEFSSLTGNRLYRSGDIGRWMTDGNIELKGRKDFQVKIRGFRVELSEIESKVISLPQVKDCVVIVKEDDRGEKKLVAYVVLEGIEVPAVKTHLRSYLPQYMLPHFVVLERLPLMPNGKVDRAALPEPPDEAEVPVEADISLINALLREEDKGGTGLEPTLARLTRPMRDQVFQKGLDLESVEVEVATGEETKTPVKPAAETETVGEPLHRLFETQALKTPDAVALAGKELALSGSKTTAYTYRQLDEASNRLARQLRDSGITPGDRVGVMFPGSVETVSSTLAALKAGAACVPIPSGTSGVPVEHMLQEAGVTTLLSHSRALKDHSFSRLKGLHARAHQPVLTPPRGQILDFDSLPIPDRSLVNYQRYADDIGLAMVKHTITLQASRGCPYNCLYCHKIWPKRHVFRSAENIFEEVRKYYDIGMRRFVFVDDIFNLDLKNSTRFFELLIKNNFDVHLFFPNGLRSDILTRDYIDLMVEAGTAGTGMALETASPRLQKLLKKNLNLEKLHENAQYLCEKHPGVIIELFTMHGFPTETEEEAHMTLDFLKSLHWIDFPYLHILKIFPNTEMATMAMENGVSEEAIRRSANLAFHELPETLPFDKSFSRQYQAEFANNYFLKKERLLAKLPHQMKVLTPDEIVQKYNSYLPTKIETMADLLQYTGITQEELGIRLEENGNPAPGSPGVLKEPAVSNLDIKIREQFPREEPQPDAFRILLLDLSQFFSGDREILYDGVEPPLGLIYLLTYLQRELGSSVNVKIAKSRADFNDFHSLKTLVEEFNPQLIGIRTLTYFADFFHQTVALLRQWGVNAPIIAGGPYATSDFTTILQDPNVDLVVMSEGELTFTQLVQTLIANNGNLPPEEELKQVPGLAFIPGEERQKTGYRDILMLDGIHHRLEDQSPAPLELPVGPEDPALLYLRPEGEHFHPVLPDHRTAIHPPDDSQGGNVPAEPALTTLHGLGGAPYQWLDILLQGGTVWMGGDPASAEGIRRLAYTRRRTAGGAKEQGLHLSVLLEPENPFTDKGAFENQCEETLADIWSELLGISRNKLGREDNFFEMGGHSLKATTLMSQVHKHFGVKVKLIEIFKAPTIREVAALIQAASTEDFTAIPQAEAHPHYPLSSAQKRLFILQQMAEIGTGYHMPVVVKLEGIIDWKRFHGTLLQLIQRHESFRTSFRMVDGKPVQVVHDTLDFSIEYYDIHGNAQPYPGEQSASWLDCRGQAMILPSPPASGATAPPTAENQVVGFMRPFDLTQAPLFRAGLIKLNDTGDSHILMVDMHHIISDGVSMVIFVREFMALYSGETPEPLKLQYKDFAAWQNNEMQRDIILGQEKFWKQQLSVELPVLDLPLDYPRPAIQSFEGQTTGFILEEKLTRELDRFALEHGLTRYMLLLSAVNILLLGLSGQEDLIIGTPEAGRSHADLDGIIGMFVNTLALRNYPQARKTLSTFFEEIKTNTLAAFENRDYPFEELVERIDVNRDTSRNPLFDVLFVLENLDLPEAEIPGLKLAPFPYQYHHAKFDLTIIAYEVDNTLEFKFEYCTKLFKPETIDRFTGYFLRVLSQLPGAVSSSLGSLELISEEEKHSILADFNNTAADYPRDHSITQLFELSLRKHLDKTALEEMSLTGEPTVRSLSYEALNRLSDAWAARLIREGVVPGTVVVLLGRRTMEMVIGILAILKAGGIYMPVDADYPAMRKNYLLTDSNAAFMVSTIPAGEPVPSIEPALPTLRLSIESPPSLNQAPPMPQPPAAETPAYIMYTSGSTGMPKGVLVTHRNVIRLVQNADYVPLNEETRILQTGAPVFDATTFEIWGALLNGGQLALVPKEVLLDAHRLGAALKQFSINTIFFSTALFNRLTQQDVEIYAPLRYLLVGGDVLSPRTINAVRHRHPDVKVINCYGPTENTTFSTSHPIEMDYPHTIPLGGPITNSTAYIVGPGDRLQPIGVWGELLLGGDGVATGYLNRPELTSEKFVTLASGQGPEGVMYRSGDVARWLPDGSLEFRGRTDFQVKIRGFRVEPDEIQNHLEGHEKIKEAVVIPRGQGAERYLCAYLVPYETQTEPQPSGLEVELREYLSQRLPEYMVPSHFLALGSLPLTSNGKLDRGALPKPETSGTGHSYKPPENESQLKLAAIWEEELEISPIGIEDNFFDIGGHSLKAIGVVNKIHKVFETQVSIKDIFQHPTVAGLSRLIGESTASAFKAIEKQPDKPYHELSYAQKRLWYLSKTQPGSTLFNMPAVMTLKEKVNEETFRRVLEQLIQRHESLRTGIKEIDKQPVLEITPADLNLLDIQVEDLTQLDDTQLAQRRAGLSLEESAHTFDLEQGSLFKARLVKCREDLYDCVFNMHHIISDGASLEILKQEFKVLYEAYKQDVPHQLPPLELQYKDYSAWQNRLLKDEDEIKKARKFWKDQFSGNMPVLSLPFDFSPGPSNTKGSAAFRFVIPQQLTGRLRGMAAQQRASLFMVLLAGFNLLLSEISGQKDILIAIPAAARQHEALRNIIGMFVNTILLRNQIDRDEPFTGFFSRLQDNTFQVLEYQSFPLELICGELKIKYPEVSVFFNMVNLGTTHREHLADLESRHIEKAQDAKFDIVCYLAEYQNGISIECHYFKDRFKPESIEKIMALYTKVLENISTDPAKKIGDYNLSGKPKKKKLKRGKR